MKNNPDLHPWKRHNKFISIPCNYLKQILRDYCIEFEEEITISKTRHFSIDILIPTKNLVIEVNGNQHYNRDGKLKSYYKKRHDFIIELGFSIIELQYYEVFNKDKIISLIESYGDKSIILPFFHKEKKTLKYGSRELYFEAVRAKSYEKAKPLIKKLIESDIEFDKFGWVGPASNIIGIKSQKVNTWMKKYMFDFYNEKCFKKKKIKD